MKKLSFVLGLILIPLLAPHSQATYSSVPTALKPFDDWVFTLDPQTREYLEMMGVKIVPEDNKESEYYCVDAREYWKRGEEKLGSCTAHGMAVSIGQSTLPMTHMTPPYPMDHEIQQGLHPVARFALGCTLFDAKPEEALSISIANSVGERHRKSVLHHVKLLDRQALADIFNMMCVVASNRGVCLPETDPFVVGSVFISRAPMKSIALKKPRDEDTQ